MIDFFVIKTIVDLILCVLLIVLLFKKGALKWS